MNRYLKSNLHSCKCEGGPGLAIQICSPGSHKMKGNTCNFPRKHTQLSRKEYLCTLAAIHCTVYSCAGTTIAVTIVNTLRHGCSSQGWTKE